MHTLDFIGRNLREILNLVHDLAGPVSAPSPPPTHCRSTPPMWGMGRIVFVLLALFATHLHRERWPGAPPVIIQGTSWRLP